MLNDLPTAKKTGPLPGDHPKVVNGKIGVLLVNLGTPDGTEFSPCAAISPSFSRPPRHRDPALALVSDPARRDSDHPPRRSGKAYASIWNREKNELPLRTFTRAQGEALAASWRRTVIVVDWAMRYGNPSIESVMANCANKAATASSSSRSIRNTAPPRQRPSTTMSSAPYENALPRLLAHLPSYHDDRSISTRWPPRSKASGDAGLQAGVHHRLLSRHSETYFERATSILPLPENRPGCCANGLAWARTADHHLPVALRPAGMAAALYRQNH